LRRQVAEGRETAKGGMDQSGVRTNMQHLVSVASKFAKTKNLHAKVGHEKKERRRKAKRGIDAVLGIGWRGCGLLAGFQLNATRQREENRNCNCLSKKTLITGETGEKQSYSKEIKSVW
jgi:hypothetical protein